jgi:hypothetical protein
VGGYSEPTVPAAARSAVAPTPERELSWALRAAGWEHQNDYSLEGGVLQLKMACPTTRVAIELIDLTRARRGALVDVSTGEESRDGDELLEEALLDRLGWRVHRVRLAEWVQTPERERDALVESLVAALARAGAPSRRAPRRPA